jgi:V/A-type H+/Na+-transporting ATPase subunit I
MSIAKVKKIEVIGLERDRQAMLDLLQRLGTVELSAGIVQTAQSRPPEAVELPELEEAINFLSSFEEKKDSFGAMFGLRPYVYAQEVKQVLGDFDYRGFLARLGELRARQKEAVQQKEKLTRELQSISGWRGLNVALDQLGPTRSSRLLLGILRTQDYPGVLQLIAKNNLKAAVLKVSQDRTDSFVFIICLEKDFPGLERVLKETHFSPVVLPHYPGTAAKLSEELKERLAVLGKELVSIRASLIRLAQERFKLMVVHDYLYNAARKEQVGRSFASQKFTFLLSGWIGAKYSGALEKELHRDFREAAIFLSDPAPGADPPVNLENQALVEPFEFITRIYGMPQYNELDPTPFLAPFFFLYVGFCISDAGYGLMVIALCLFAMKKFKMGPTGKRFFRMFFFCGISTVIMGALTGSWFGNLLDLVGESNPALMPVKHFKDSLVLLDPLKEPTKLLGIALSLGVVQVWFGNIVAAIGNIKNKRYLDIFFDQVSMLVFLFGMTGLGLSFLRIVSASPWFNYTAAYGSVALVLTQGRSEKGIGSRLFYGGYNLYNAFSGYLSDILSFSRLWALGLVTGVMANTINLISIQFSSILVNTIGIGKVPVAKMIVGGLILIIVFLAGHAVAFMMNILGAFVHPLRLQFVEFFSKFFKSGGRAFKPFRVETKYVNLS